MAAACSILGSPRPRPTRSRTRSRCWPRPRCTTPTSTTSSSAPPTLPGRRSGSRRRRWRPDPNARPPAARPLARLADTADHDTLRELEARLPRASTVLAPTAAATTAALAASYRRLVEAAPDAYLPDLAMSLNTLGVWLAAVGRREQAMAPAEEAVDLYRRLAEASPAMYADRAHLAAELVTSLGSVPEERGPFWARRRSRACATGGGALDSIDSSSAKQRLNAAAAWQQHGGAPHKSESDEYFGNVRTQGFRKV